MQSACRHFIAALATACSLGAGAAPYPDEGQLQRALATGGEVLHRAGLDQVAFDARRAGLALPLLAAGLNLDTGVCVVFYDSRPEEALLPFFARLDERDLPIWLSAIAVHEATHCVEQREAYLRRHFDKVLPPAIATRDMDAGAYLAVVRSGALETWGEALADIAAVVYLQRAFPGRWRDFAAAMAGLRRELAGARPEHDTSGWLCRLSGTRPAAEDDIFEAAFRLRRELGAAPAAGTADCPALSEKKGLPHWESGRPGGS